MRKLFHVMLLVAALATGVFPQVSREEALRLYDSSLRLYQAAVKAGTPESYKMALQEARLSTVADPSLAKAWILKGHILKQFPGDPGQQRANRESALKDYDKGISLDPATAEAWFGRGNLQCDIASALKWEKPTGIGVSDQFGKYMFGFTDSRGLLQKEVFDLAISDYTKALTLNQSDQIYFVRGMCHQRKLDAARAKADFEAAVKLNPSNEGAKAGLQSSDAIVQELKRLRGDR